MSSEPQLLLDEGPNKEEKELASFTLLSFLNFRDSYPSPLFKPSFNSLLFLVSIQQSTIAIKDLGNRVAVDVLERAKESSDSFDLFLGSK